MAQIRWLSELALFNFDIKYQTDKSNKAADTLSNCPQLDNKGVSDGSSEKYEMVSCASACEYNTSVLNVKKLPIESKTGINSRSENQVSMLVIGADIVFNIIVVLSETMPEDMLIAQKEGSKIGKIMRYVKLGKKPSQAEI